MIVTDLDEGACETVAESISLACGAGTVTGIGMDVSSEKSVREAFRRAALAYGGLDILVSNAGIAHSARIDELNNSIAEIDRLTTTIDEEKAREESEITKATARLEAARAEADLLANELAELNRNAASRATTLLVSAKLPFPLPKAAGR